MDNPQTIAAIAIVGITAAIFLYNIFFRKKKKGGCSSSCDCPVDEIKKKEHK